MFLEVLTKVIKMCTAVHDGDRCFNYFSLKHRVHQGSKITKSTALWCFFFFFLNSSKHRWVHCGAWCFLFIYFSNSPGARGALVLFLDSKAPKHQQVVHGSVFVLLLI
jgi:hypothetical protein